MSIENLEIGDRGTRRSDGRRPPSAFRLQSSLFPVLPLLLVLIAAPTPATAQFSAQGNPFQTVGPGTRAWGDPTVFRDAVSRLPNARIFHPGGPASPGRWEVRGDGSGPIIVGGDVYVPGGPGRRGGWVSGEPDGDPYAGGDRRDPGSLDSGYPTARELLKSVEERLLREREERSEDAEESEEEEKPLELLNLEGMPPDILLRDADALDVDLRASALAALPQTELTTTQRRVASAKLRAALDAADLRLVQIAAGAAAAMGLDEASGQLLWLLNLDDEATLLAVSRALAELAPEGAEEKLDELANATEGELRRTALVSAQKIRMRRRTQEAAK